MLMCVFFFVVMCVLVGVVCVVVMFFVYVQNNLNFLNDMLISYFSKIDCVLFFKVVVQVCDEGKDGEIMMWQSSGCGMQIDVKFMLSMIEVDGKICCEVVIEIIVKGQMMMFKFVYCKIVVGKWQLQKC